MKISLGPKIALIFLLALVVKPAHAEIKRPLFFIPGITGSQLEIDNEVIWGKLSSVNKLDKLSISSGPRDPSDGVVATDIIRGVSFLGVEWKKQYSPLVKYLESNLGYVLGENLFLFPYDWRRSNAISAQLFKEYLNSIDLDTSDGIDIVAHSMGGLVAKLYILDNSEDHSVVNLITMGTPFYGSVQMLDTVIRGWGPVTSLVGGADRVRQILLSFPSVYELFPHYKNCCVWGKKSGSAEDKEAFLMTELGFWKAGNWFDKDESEWLNTLEETLANTESIQKKLVLPLPNDVKLWTVSGTGNITKYQAYFDPDNISEPAKAIDTYIYTDGDSSVTRPIASFGRLAESFPSWSKHGTVFDDETAKRKLRDILLSEGDISPDNISARSLVLTTIDAKEIEVSEIQISLDKVQYVSTEPVIVSLSIATSEVDLQSTDKIRLRFSTAEGVRFELAQLTRVDEIDFYDYTIDSIDKRKIYVFESTINVEGVSGLVSVAVADTNIGHHADEALIVETSSDN